MWLVLSVRKSGSHEDDCTKTGTSAELASCPSGKSLGAHGVAEVGLSATPAYVRSLLHLPLLGSHSCWTGGWMESPQLQVTTVSS